jgi:hypothetical protein
MNCIACNEELTGRQTKFCSNQCKAKHSGNSYPNQKARALKRKIEFVNRLGGSCSKCGYNANLAALEFHHLQDKDFGLDSRTISNTTKEALEKELSKCILLCSNCHRELHHPHLFNFLSS